MASAYRHRSGHWYVAVTLASGRRVHLHVGSVTKAQAQHVARNIEALAASVRVGLEPPKTIADWVSVCDRSFLERLDGCGLLRTCQQRTSSPEVVVFLDQFVAKRTDFSPSTKKGFATARLHMAARFAGRTMESITVSDARQYARDMSQQFSSSHAKKLVERASQLFREAVDAKLLESNPFAGVRLKAVANKERQSYIPRDIAMQVLERMPNTQGRTLFALARFAGLRIPHEALALTWNCIDWDLQRITIPSDTKTGGRVVPLFPEVLPLLTDLREIVPDGCQWVFDTGRASAATTWRWLVKTAIQEVGLKPWPKLFVNLRASCRTDLEDRFPSHVCDAWLGHSTRVAKDHYLQVTPEHWSQAVYRAPASSPRPLPRKGVRAGSNGAVRAKQKQKNRGNL